MPHPNYTTSKDREFSLIPWKSYKKTVMQRRMELRLPRGIAPITVRLSAGAAFPPVTPKGAQLTHRLVPEAIWITSDAFLLCEMKCSSSAEVTSHHWQPEGLFDQWFLVKSSLQSSQGLQKGQNFRVLWLLIRVDLELFALVPIKAAMPNGFAYATRDTVTPNSTQQKENLDSNHWLWSYSATLSFSYLSNFLIILKNLALLYLTYTIHVAVSVLLYVSPCLNSNSYTDSL